jgi:hypothetical protein
MKKVQFFSVHPMSIPNGVLVALGPLWALQKCIYHLLFGWVSLVKPEEKV